jgi:hypothetical protein
MRNLGRIKWAVVAVVITIVAGAGLTISGSAEALTRTKGVVSARVTPAPMPSSVSGLPGAGVSAADGTRPTLSLAAQTSRNDKADATFEVRPAADGGIEVVGTSGGLNVKKVVHASGESVLTLGTDHDNLSIATTAQGITVTRNKTTLSLLRSDASEANGDKIRRLLADSQAVRQFRRMSATLIETDDRAPASLAAVIGDAVIGQLTGDVGAPRRAAAHLARRSSKLKPVALRPDCFAGMEANMMYAAQDVASCYSSVGNNSFWEDMCSIRWVLQAESYWFEFLSCTGFSGAIF